MRKLNLKDYIVIGKVKNSDPSGPPLLEISMPYPVKDSILTVLFVRELGLTGAELVKQYALALKIEGCKEDEILLEEEEWRRLETAINTAKGFGKNDVELVMRILKAPQVEVNLKPSQ